MEIILLKLLIILYCKFFSTKLKINILKINHYLKNNDIDKYIEVKPSEIDFR